MTDPTTAPPMERLAWRVYTGDPMVVPAPIAVPDAPSWRRFDHDAEPVAEDLAVEDADAGATFRATPEMVDAVNAALHLRLPLLLTGRPGFGQVVADRPVARELCRPRCCAGTSCPAALCWTRCTATTRSADCTRRACARPTREFGDACRPGGVASATRPAMAAAHRPSTGT